jgi:hypothetical protein
MASTTYDIRLRYLLDDKASKGLDGIGHGAERAARGTGLLSGTLGKLGALAAGGFGIQQAGKALIGFNSNVEDTKIQIAGMLALARKTDLADELKVADKVFSSLQQRAKSLPGTTAEYARFAGMITQPIVDAGLGMKDLEDLTVNSVVAAKALGIEAEVAARDIDQALRGQFRSTDVFSGKLLGSIGYKGEAGRAKYNAMGGDQRAAELKKALMQKQLTQMADAQGKTFSGVMSTFQDTLQQTLGKVGLPLFKAITDELKRWNAWADANADRLDAWGRTFGEALVAGFGYVKDAIGFLVDHKDELIAIAKVWLAMKAGQSIASLGQSIVGGYGALGGKVSGAKGLAGAAGPLAAAGMVGWEIGTMLRDTELGSGIESLAEGAARLAGVWSDAAAEQDRQFKKIQAEMKELHDATSKRAQDAKNSKATGARATLAYTNLMGVSDVAFNRSNDAADAQRFFGQYGMGNPAQSAYATLERQRGQYLEGRADMGATQTDTMLAYAMQQLTETQRNAVNVEQVTQKVMADMNRALSGSAEFGGKARFLSYEEVIGIVRAAAGADDGGKPGGKAIKAPGKVNVTIQRIEVKSDDPDRFAFGLVEVFRDIAKNPAGAAAAIREG